MVTGLFDIAIGPSRDRAMLTSCHGEVPNMSPAWTDSSRLRSSATNHDCNSADDLRTLDDDIASLLGVEDEDDGYSEEEAMDDSVGFKKSLKMPPFVHAKRKLAQLIGMFLD